MRVKLSDLVCQLLLELLVLHLQDVLGSLIDLAKLILVGVVLGQVLQGVAELLAEVLVLIKMLLVGGFGCLQLLLRFPKPLLEVFDF